MRIGVLISGTISTRRRMCQGMVFDGPRCASPTPDSSEHSTMAEATELRLPEPNGTRTHRTHRQDTETTMGTNQRSQITMSDDEIATYIEQSRVATMGTI